MQSRIRKKRCHAIYRDLKKQARRSTLTCFQIISVIAYSACSHVKKDPTTWEPSPLTKELSQLCFSGEGRGRIRFLQERHLFRYESLFSYSEGQFALAMNLPVYGEELMRLSWSYDPTFQWQIQGSFYERLQHQLKQNRQTKKQAYEVQLLHDYLSSLAFFFSFYQQLLRQEMKVESTSATKDVVNCRLEPLNNAGDVGKGSCTYRAKKLDWELLESGELRFKTVLDNGLILSLKNLDKQDGFYRRLDLALEKGLSGSIPSGPVELSLFASGCQNPLSSVSK